jgi:hypothetical protein
MLCCVVGSCDEGEMTGALPRHLPVVFVRLIVHLPDTKSKTPRLPFRRILRRRSACIKRLLTWKSRRLHVLISKWRRIQTPKRWNSRSLSLSGLSTRSVSLRTWPALKMIKKPHTTVTDWQRVKKRGLREGQKSKGQMSR